jgi:hypothetical protein
VTQQIMDTCEGAAWRVQLDGMLRTLEPLEQAAIEARDDSVIVLLNHLRLAREAAVSIEDRAPLQYKGVKLTRD